MYECPVTAILVVFGGVPPLAKVTTLNVDSLTRRVSGAMRTMAVAVLGLMVYTAQGLPEKGNFPVAHARVPVAHECCGYRHGLSTLRLKPTILLCIRPRRP